MKVSDILKHPNPLLRRGSKKPSALPGTLAAETFINLMLKADGIGLASAQIGDEEPYVAVLTDEGPIFAWKPKIIRASKELQVQEEGCLSVPGIYGLVRRPMEITVEYVDVHGKKQKWKGDGLTATCWQHELDHLEGILFIDKAFEITKGEELLRKQLGGAHIL